MDYSNPYEQQNSSLAHQMFGSPLRAQWTFQKASMSLNALSGDMWKAGMRGKGLTWSGVVGFRGIALGQGAYGSDIAKSLSPSKFIGGVINQFSKDLGSKFERGGLFGEGGIWNVSGKEGASNFFGRLLGGGTIEATKFDPSVVSRYEDEMKIFKKSTKLWKKSLREFKKGSATMRENVGVAFSRKYKHGNFFNYARGKSTSQAEAIGEKISKARTERFMETKLQRIMSGKPTAPIKSLAYKNAKFISRLSKIGRAASVIGWTSLAFDVGSSIGGFVVDSLGNAADTLERQMGSVFNRQMEFGGKVGIGFFSGGAGTERQRALSAIGRGYGGGGAMGNEASYQHVDSTW